MLITNHPIDIFTYILLDGHFNIHGQFTMNVYLLYYKKSFES